MDEDGDWTKYRDGGDVREGLDEVLLIDGSGTFLGNWSPTNTNRSGCGMNKHACVRFHKHQRRPSVFLNDSELVL